jgi:hypothetical protein
MDSVRAFLPIYYAKNIASGGPVIDPIIVPIKLKV